MSRLTCEVNDHAELLDAARVLVGCYDARVTKYGGVVSEAPHYVESDSAWRVLIALVAPERDESGVECKARTAEEELDGE